MKSLAFSVCVLLLFSSVGVVWGTVPRHVDPEQYTLVEPDSETLFLLYHNLYEGMIQENLTVQEEWIRLIDEVYSVEDLAPLLESYNAGLDLQVDNMNLTRRNLEQAFQYIVDYNLSAAQSSFFTSFMYLNISMGNISSLRDTTVEIGAVLGSEPSMLLDDIDQLESLLGRYNEVFQLLEDYLNGELDSGDVDRIKDSFAEYVDSGALNQIEAYLDSLGDDANLTSVQGSTLSLGVNVSEAWVGGCVKVSGRLRSGGAGLGGRVLSLEVGDMVVSVLTDADGGFSVDLGVPYLYQSSVEIRGYYWPNELDAYFYSPATAYTDIGLLYFSPYIEVDYPVVAYPGRCWSLSGRLLHSGAGLKGGFIEVDGFGESVETVSDDDGMFSVSLLLSSNHTSGLTSVSVRSQSMGVYESAVEKIVVNVTKVPLVLDVVEPGFVLTGFPAQLKCMVSVDGVPLSGCLVEVFSGAGYDEAYSEDGAGLVQVDVPLLHLGGTYNWRVVADPVEPWIESDSVQGSFRVVNSFFVLFCAGAFLGGVYYLRRVGFGKPELETFETVVEEEPVVEPVAEPVSLTGFSGLFLAALRVVEGLSGVVLAPSDTLREYLGRLSGRLSGRVGVLFRELVARYELWLYGKPHEPELDRVEVLVAGVEGENDED